MGRLNVTAVIAFLGRDTLGGRGSAKQLSRHLPALQIGARMAYARAREASCDGAFSALLSIDGCQKL